MQDLISLIILILILSVLAFGLLKKAKKTTKGLAGQSIWIERNQYPYPEYIRVCKERLEALSGTVFKPLTDKDYNLRALWAIIAHETGWFSDPQAKQAVCELNNIFGIEAAGILRKFESVDQCVQFFDYILTKKPDTAHLYKEAYKFRMIGEQFIIALHNAGYNRSSLWLSSVLKIYQAW